MTEVGPTIRIRLSIEDLLRQRVPLFDGIEALLQLADEVPALAQDRDVQKLAALLAEAEHLPVGAARVHWAKDARHRADRELMALERKHQDSASYACRRLLATLGSR